MPKFRIYAEACASIYVGEYEGETEDEALNAAYDDKDSQPHFGLCHHCSHIDISDHELRAEPIDASGPPDNLAGMSMAELLDAYSLNVSILWANQSDDVLSEAIEAVRAEIDARIARTLLQARAARAEARVGELEEFKDKFWQCSCGAYYPKDDFFPATAHPEAEPICPKCVVYSNMDCAVERNAEFNALQAERDGLRDEKETWLKVDESLRYEHNCLVEIHNKLLGKLARFEKIEAEAMKEEPKVLVETEPGLGYLAKPAHEIINDLLHWARAQALALGVERERNYLLLEFIEEMHPTLYSLIPLTMKGPSDAR